MEVTDCYPDGEARWTPRPGVFHPLFVLYRKVFFSSFFLTSRVCFLTSSCQSPGGNAPAAYRSHSAQSCRPKWGHLVQVIWCQVSETRSSPDDQAAASSCIASVVVLTSVKIPQDPQSIKVSAWYFMRQHGAASQYAFVGLLYVGGS